MKVLHIDDDDIIRLYLARACHKIRPDLQLVDVADAEAASVYLRDLVGKKEEERPVLILLDLGLPRMDGFGFLAMFRENPLPYKLPPVWVLSGSDREQDSVLASDHEVERYFNKDRDLETLVTALSWL